MTTHDPMTTVDQAPHAKAKTPLKSQGMIADHYPGCSPAAQIQHPEIAAPINAPVHISKLARLIALLHSPDGATIEAMCEVTGWQAHSVRGAMAGTLKRKGLMVVSTKPEDGARRYRIADAS